MTLSEIRTREFPICWPKLALSVFCSLCLETPPADANMKDLAFTQFNSEMAAVLEGAKPSNPILSELTQKSWFIAAKNSLRRNHDVRLRALGHSLCLFDLEASICWEPVKKGNSIGLKFSAVEEAFFPGAMDSVLDFEKALKAFFLRQIFSESARRKAVLMLFFPRSQAKKQETYSSSLVEGQASVFYATLQGWRAMPPDPKVKANLILGWVKEKRIDKTVRCIPPEGKVPCVGAPGGGCKPKDGAHYADMTMTLNGRRVRFSPTETPTTEMMAINGLSQYGPSVWLTTEDGKSVAIGLASARKTDDQDKVKWDNLSGTHGGFSRTFEKSPEYDEAHCRVVETEGVSMGTVPVSRAQCEQIMASARKKAAAGKDGETAVIRYVNQVMQDESGAIGRMFSSKVKCNTKVYECSAPPPEQGWWVHATDSSREFGPKGREEGLMHLLGKGKGARLSPGDRAELGKVLDAVFDYHVMSSCCADASCLSLIGTSKSKNNDGSTTIQMDDLRGVK